MLGDHGVNGKPLISVIIIFLNAERFIPEAIESVFSQTYANWELFLVDDGSTDQSTQIALGYTARYPEKVRYLEHDNHENRGMSASRNLGITHARGKYIAFLDADDVWLPHKLERQVAILEAQPEAGMVYGSTQCWHSWTGNPEDIARDFVPKLAVEPNTLVKPGTLLTASYPLGSGSAPCPSDLLFRREVIERVGGFEESFRGKYQLYEDQAFLAKVYLKERVFVSSECWDKYRLHPDSCVSVVNREGQYHSVRLFFLNWLEQYLTTQGVKDVEVWRALRKALWPYRHPILFRLSRRVRHLQEETIDPLKDVARQILPAPVHSWLKAQWRGERYKPPVGWVRFGSLRRFTPISGLFGFDRGVPIDRYYIERFLLTHASDIRGRVLEIGDDSYTRKFGGDRVSRSDVLHVAEGNAKATIVADLTSADHIPSDIFDCAILTQTLQFIYDARAALKTLYRILKPGGILLATFPGISQISRSDMERWGEYWRFTTLSAYELFIEAFPDDCVTIRAYGNVLTAAAFLYGLVSEELRREELDRCDPDYEVLLTVRAFKPRRERTWGWAE